MVSVCMPGDPGPLIFDATVIAHLFMNLQYVKQKNHGFPRLILRHAHTLEAAGLVSCPVLRSAAILFQPPARSATKKASTSNGSHAPAENERLCSFCIQKDLIQQIRSNRTMCVRACQSFSVEHGAKRRAFALPFVLDRCLHRAGDDQFADAGGHSPRPGHRVLRIRCCGNGDLPAVVANRPVVPS